MLSWLVGVGGMDAASFVGCVEVECVGVEHKLHMILTNNELYT